VNQIDGHSVGWEGSLYDRFIPWMEEMVKKLRVDFPLEEYMDVIPEDVCLPPSASLIPSEAEPLVESNYEDRRLELTVSNNNRVTSKEHFQDTREITLDSELPLKLVFIFFLMFIKN
jgi:hypothetical protein